MNAETRNDDAMLEATVQGDCTELARLVAHGAGVNTLYEWGFPLYIATMHGHAAFVRELVRLGANVDCMEGIEHLPPIDCVSRGSIYIDESHNIDMLATLLELGADPNIVYDYDRITPLHAALSQRNQETACHLLRGGADPCMCDRHGASGFDYAVRFGAEKVIGLLPEIGGSDYADQIRKARLQFEFLRAAYEGNEEKVIACIDSGVNLNVVNPRGYDALAYAAECGHTDIIRLLLKNGSDPNNIRTDWTALMRAAKGGHREAFDLLLEAGADLFAEVEIEPGVFISVYETAKVGSQRKMMTYISKLVKLRSDEDKT